MTCVVSLDLVWEVLLVHVRPVHAVAWELSIKYLPQRRGVARRSSGAVGGSKHPEPCESNLRAAADRSTRINEFKVSKIKIVAPLLTDKQMEMRKSFLEKQKRKSRLQFYIFSEYVN